MIKRETTMARQEKTQRIIDQACQVLTEHHPMTVRQVYYQLVSRQVVENNRGRYQAVSDALVDARKEGIIAWEWIEDRLRQPRHVNMWEDLADFGQTICRAYRRDVWRTQPHYLEVWLEKDALSGLFSDVIEDYGITLNVGRGYDGWASIHNAAERLGDDDTVLYWGDFDPSGEDMVRSLQERLAHQGSRPSIVKCALTLEDIERYRLPPNFTKVTDTRRAAFVARYGDVSVELDALPAAVLQERLRAEVEKRMDLEALAEVRRVEEQERAQVAAAVGLNGNE